MEEEQCAKASISSCHFSGGEEAVNTRGPATPAVLEPRLNSFSELAKSDF